MRYFRQHGTKQADDIALKVYSITIDGSEVQDLSAILEDVTSIIVTSALIRHPHHAVGYLIYHKGKEAHWLLIRLWVEGDIVAGLLGRWTEHGFQLETRPYIECVWEGAVSNYERLSFIRYMMNESPDRESYLSDVMADGKF